MIYAADLTYITRQVYTALVRESRAATGKKSNDRENNYAHFKKKSQWAQNMDKIPKSNQNSAPYLRMTLHLWKNVDCSSSIFRVLFLCHVPTHAQFKDAKQKTGHVHHLRPLLSHIFEITIESREGEKNWTNDTFLPSLLKYVTNSSRIQNMSSKELFRRTLTHFANTQGCRSPRSSIYDKQTFVLPVMNEDTL